MRLKNRSKNLAENKVAVIGGMRLGRMPKVTAYALRIKTDSSKDEVSLK
jgi:hypothetical protein